MDIPQNLRYTGEHEWLLSEGEVATVGITDYAQQLLGDVVFVELPEEGTELEKGESLGVVESVKAASDIYAPVSGEVVEINQELEEHPEHVNQFPYGKGWIVKVKIKNPAQIEELMDPDRYREFVLKEQESR